MPFWTKKSNCPDVDAITLQSRVYARALGTTYRPSPEPLTVPPGYIVGSNAPTPPRTFQTRGNTAQGYPGLFEGYAPYGPDSFRGFDASRPISPCREWRPDVWGNRVQAGEEVVDVHSISSSNRDAQDSRKETKTGKGRGWIFYVCIVLVVGAFLGLLGGPIPKYYNSHHAHKSLRKEEVNEEGLLTTLAYNTKNKVTTRTPLLSFTSIDKVEKRGLSTIRAQLDNYDTGKTTATANTSTYSAALKDGLTFVPHIPFSTSYSRRFITKTIVSTTSILATVTEYAGRSTSYNNCCPTITSYYPNLFHCPSPKLHPQPTLQCPYMPFKTPELEDLKTMTITSTTTLPCSAQPSKCRLPNGDFCIPETTYVPNPTACPTTCALLPTAVVITHVVIAHPHGDFMCVVDADSGELRDATKDEKYDMAGGRGWYEWDRYVQRPAKGVFRLLGELGKKGLRKVGKRFGLGKKKAEVVQVVEDGIEDS